jgi:polar amino acid transport system substrate-binding protein
MTTGQTLRATLLGTLAAITATLALAAQEADLSPEQPGRIRAEPVPEAIALIPEGYKFVTPGKFTVAHSTGRLPFATYATDTKTPVGSEPDLAQLVADSLGLELESIPIAWADWPLGIVSGKYDAVISNVTVTEERKEKYDFSTYRRDDLGFYVAKDSAITEITKPEHVAGLKVIVGSGTNQEQILLRWIEDNKAAGLPDTEVQYHDDDAARELAIQSGRADAYLGPNVLAAYEAKLRGTTRLVGNVPGGYPLTAEIAVVTGKGSGLADAVTAAINAQIKNGNYIAYLERWNNTAEAISESRTNPPGLPKK